MFTWQKCGSGRTDDAPLPRLGSIHHNCLLLQCLLPRDPTHTLHRRVLCTWRSTFYLSSLLPRTFPSQPASWRVFVRRSLRGKARQEHHNNLNLNTDIKTQNKLSGCCKGWLALALALGLAWPGMFGWDQRDSCNIGKLEQAVVVWPPSLPARCQLLTTIIREIRCWTLVSRSSHLVSGAGRRCSVSTVIFEYLK